MEKWSDGEMERGLSGNPEKKKKNPESNYTVCDEKTLPQFSIRLQIMNHSSALQICGNSNESQ